jgi:hypothetical protein
MGAQHSGGCTVLSMDILQTLGLDMTGHANTLTRRATPIYWAHSTQNGRKNTPRLDIHHPDRTCQNEHTNTQTGRTTSKKGHTETQIGHTTSQRGIYNNTQTGHITYSEYGDVRSATNTEPGGNGNIQRPFRIHTRHSESIQNVHIRPEN